MAVRPTDPEALHLFQLIGAPLLAVIQAEAQAAQVSADFIKRVGFDASTSGAGPSVTAPAAATGAAPAAQDVRGLQDGGNLGQLRVAEFQIDRTAADGTSVPHVARVPVLSLFPIPLLQVKHADFEFDIRVLSRVPLEAERGDKGAPSLSEDYLAKNRVELKGFLASSRGEGAQATTDASIKMKVRMEQSDMPAGLIHLMKIMGESVTVAPLALLEQGKSRPKDGRKP